MQLYQIFIKYKNCMLRVHLNVNKVGIRIKEQINLQVVIKKGKQNFTLPKTAKLQKCNAQLDASCQFFIQENQPNFTIFIMIILGQVKKLAGSYPVCLLNYSKNVKNCIVGRLQKCPDPEGVISLQFIYQQTSYMNKDRNLIQFGQIEQKKMQGMAEQMDEQNQKLGNQNSRLKNQLQDLQKQNLNLVANKNIINQLNQKEQKMEEERCEMGEKLNKIRQYSHKHTKQEVENQIFQTFKHDK